MSYSEAIKEAFACSTSNIPIINSIELSHPAFSLTREYVDICFVVDDTGSMGGVISTIKSNILEIAELMDVEFRRVRWSLCRFKDEDDVTLPTGSLFVDYETFSEKVQELSAGGGGDGPEDGYGALKKSSDELNWDASLATARVSVLFTDAASHERGATEAQALAALQSKGIILHYGPTSRTSYESLRIETGGTVIPTTGDFAREFVDAVKNVPAVEGTDSIYLVDQRTDLELRLENGELKTFRRSGISITLPESGEGGLQELNIGIDNTDRFITDFLNALLKYDTPAPVIYRPYIPANFDVGPEMDPPLRLNLTDISVQGSVITGRAVFADLLNRKFLTQNYTRRRFPSLGGQ